MMVLRDMLRLYSGLVSMHDQASPGASRPACTVRLLHQSSSWASGPRFGVEGFVFQLKINKGHMEVVYGKEPEKCKQGSLATSNQTSCHFLNTSPLWSCWIPSPFQCRSFQFAWWRHPPRTANPQNEKEGTGYNYMVEPWYQWVDSNCGIGSLSKFAFL